MMFLTRGNRTKPERLCSTAALGFVVFTLLIATSDAGRSPARSAIQTAQKAAIAAFNSKTPNAYREALQAYKTAYKAVIREKGYLCERRKTYCRNQIRMLKTGLKRSVPRAPAQKPERAFQKAQDLGRKRRAHAEAHSPKPKRDIQPYREFKRQYDENLAMKKIKQWRAHLKKEERHEAKQKRLADIHDRIKNRPFPDYRTDDPLNLRDPKFRQAIADWEALMKTDFDHDKRSNYAPHRKPEVGPLPGFKDAYRRSIPSSSPTKPTRRYPDVMSQVWSGARQYAYSPRYATAGAA